MLFSTSLQLLSSFIVVSTVAGGQCAKRDTGTCFDGSDPFDGTGNLDPKWDRFAATAGYTYLAEPIQEGSLKIEIDANVKRDFYVGRSDTVPRYFQTLDDQDFDVRVFLEATGTDLAPNPSERFNDHGLYLRIDNDDSKFYRWSVFTDGSGNPEYRLWAGAIDGRPTSQIQLRSAPATFVPLYIGIKRTGQKLVFYYVTGSGSNTDMKLFTETMPDDRSIDAVGLFAANGNQNVDYKGSFKDFTLECTNDCNSGSSGGDPHFSTFSGEFFDFHGQCDLMFLDAPNFDNGNGLTIHLRTTLRYAYSFIESLALKIGTDILQVSSYGDYMVNGISQASLPNNLSGFTVNHTQVSDIKHRYVVDLGNSGNSDEMILIETFKDWVSVKVQHLDGPHFKDSTGMMGEFHTGTKLARDGVTVLVDSNAFGQEWQVLNSEPMLFQTVRAPQYPEKCIMPDESTSQLRRRLGEHSVTKEAAELACAHLNGAKMEACVYDVMATGDLDMAQAGAF